MADVFDQAAPGTKTGPKQKVTAQVSKGGDVFDQAAVSAPSSAPQSDDSADQFSQDRAVTEAWAQGHPFLGPIARFLVSGGQGAANVISGTPGAAYHAMTDPPAPEESGLPYQQRVIARLLGAKQAAQAASDYASGGVTPKGAASVLPEALGTGLGQVTGGAVYGKLGQLAGDIPAGRIAKATGAAIKGGAAPIVGPVAGGAIRGAVKSWQASAPPTPEQLNPALVSPSRTLPGMNPPEVTGRPMPGPIQGPSRGLMLPGETEPPMIPASKVSTTPPKSSPMSKADVLARARSIAQQPGTGVISREPSGPQTLIAGQPVSANADLTPGLQVPPARIQGKIMQVVRREGTLGMERLMEAPELKGISRGQIENAVTSLSDSKKVWAPTKEADAHGPAGIISIAIRRR